MGPQIGPPRIGSVKARARICAPGAAGWETAWVLDGGGVALERELSGEGGNAEGGFDGEVAGGVALAEVGEVHVLEHGGEDHGGGDGVRVEEVGIDDLLPGGEELGEVGDADAVIECTGEVAPEGGDVVAADGEGVRGG